MESASNAKDFQRALDALRQLDVKVMRPAIDEEAIEGLKISEYLIASLATEMLGLRLQDSDAVQKILAMNLHCANFDVS
jgi:ATP-dependent Lhr-like helicase